MTNVLATGIAAGPLRIFEDARREIADAETINKVKKILAVATGLAAAARQARDRELEAEAAVLRLEAERKLGQLIEAQRETVGLNIGTAGRGRPALGQVSDTPPNGDDRPTLAEAGIDKNLAKRARRAGAMTGADFEKAIDAKRTAVLSGTKRKRQAKPKPAIPESAAGRRSPQEFDPEKYACILAMHVKQTGGHVVERPRDIDAALDLLLANAEFLDGLVALARLPKVRALIEKVASKIGGGADQATSDRELQIPLIGLESENEELRMRLAELEQQAAAADCAPTASMTAIGSDASTPSDEPAASLSVEDDGLSIPRVPAAMTGKPGRRGRPHGSLRWNPTSLAGHRLMVETEMWLALYPTRRYTIPPSIKWKMARQIISQFIEWGRFSKSEKPSVTDVIKWARRHTPARTLRRPRKPSGDAGFYDAYERELRDSYKTVKPDRS